MYLVTFAFDLFSSPFSSDFRDRDRSNFRVSGLHDWFHVHWQNEYLVSFAFPLKSYYFSHFSAVPVETAQTLSSNALLLLCFIYAGNRTRSIHKRATKTTCHVTLCTADFFTLSCVQPSSLYPYTPAFTTSKCLGNHRGSN